MKIFLKAFIVTVSLLSIITIQGDALEKAPPNVELEGNANGIVYIPGDEPFLLGKEMSMIFTDNPSYAFQSAEYLKGFALEAILTCVLFSYMGYFSGHNKTIFVMIQGLAQTFLVRLPMSYLMSIRPNPSLSLIGLAGPSATLFGILINVVYYIIINRKKNTTEIAIE